jgi:hypothetical protein
MEKVLLKIEEVLSPKPARGKGRGVGLRVSVASGWCAQPLPKKAFGHRKKGQESTARNT